MPRIAEIPFDAANKYMATFHKKEGQIQVFVKGAPDVLIEHCTSWMGHEGESVLDSEAKDALLAENESLARGGLRVLAAASSTFPAEDFDPDGDLFRYIDDLRLDGLAGLIDPPRAEARDEIGRASCRERV